MLTLCCNGRSLPMYKEQCGQKRMLCLWALGDGQAEAVAAHMQGIRAQDGVHAFTHVRTELDLRGVSRFVTALRAG